MRGNYRETLVEQLIIEPDFTPMSSSSQSTSGRATPDPVEEESFPSVMAELENRIEELKEHIYVRNTHRRVKHIAARLVEILPAIRDSMHGSNSGSIIPSSDVRTDSDPKAHAALLRHEAMLAELLRKTGADEATTQLESSTASDPSGLHYLVTELVAQWGEIRAILGQAEHPTSFADPPFMVETLPPPDSR